jgi:hypothetical protein
MTRARTALVLAGSALLVSGLSACDKPNPGATVFSGTTSAFQRAVCWSPGPGSIDVNACAKKVIGGPPVATIPVVPGEVIGISVDPVVADAQWQIQFAGQTVPSAPISGTYFRLTFPQLSAVPAEGMALQLVAGKTGEVRGVWLFKLVPAT